MQLRYAAAVATSVELDGSGQELLAATISAASRMTPQITATCEFFTSNSSGVNVERVRCDVAGSQSPPVARRAIVTSKMPPIKIPASSAARPPAAGHFAGSTIANRPSSVP